MTGTVLLTLNAGSSSLKFALFDADASGPARARGRVEGLGAKPNFRVTDEGGAVLATRDWAAGEGPATAAAALDLVIDWVDAAMPGLDVAAVGHRVVHGGLLFEAPVVVDDRIVDLLDDLDPLAPLHQPHNLAGIAAARAAFPRALQVACFDTAFHRTRGPLEEMFALPRALHEEGVRRYGFHGLSYEYVSRSLGEIDPAMAKGRVIIAHLGNGASMCALIDGRSVATTMGFSALDGLPMGTRVGQLDPGVMLHLMSAKKMDAAALSDLLYKKSGLLGLSGVSQDMRALEASSAPEAAEAIAYMAHRIRRETGALTAVLGGLDGFVFTGGIGENSVRMRREALAGMEWLGIALDEAANAGRAPVISTADARVRVRVVPTDEETMIADHTRDRLAAGLAHAAA